MPEAMLSFAVSARASGVRVSEGATTLTRTFGASSAASDRARPSTAPFARPTEAWAAKPCATATRREENDAGGPLRGPEGRERRLHGPGGAERVDAEIRLEILVGQPRERLQVDRADRVDERRKPSSGGGFLRRPREQARIGDVAGGRRRAEIRGRGGEARGVAGDEVDPEAPRLESARARGPDAARAAIDQDLPRHPVSVTKGKLGQTPKG
jgi:hypothetical protein